MLFREEAIKHAAMNSLGEVILTQAVSRTVWMAVFSCIGLALVLYFCLCGYTEKAEVSGVLVGTRGQLEADLDVPASAVGFLQPGMPVQLRYGADPYRRPGLTHGVVEQVASTAIGPADIAPLAGNLQGGPGHTPVYRVRVRLERQFVMAHGSKEPLRAGSTVSASLLTERHRLIEWVFWTLYSSGGRG